MSTPGRGPSFRLLSSMLGFGLVLQVVGFFVAVLQLPRFEVAAPLERHGSLAGTSLGLLVFGLGGVLSLIGVVGFGVLLGLRAHAEETPATTAPQDGPETTRPGP